MDEFANKLSKRAAEVLRRNYYQEPAPQTDPILELVVCLLEDGAGGVQSPTEVPVTTSEWLTWNELVMEQKVELLRAMTRVLEREKTELPLETGAMRSWAATLLLSTLDEMESV